jgi:hypothetical protein
MAAGSTYTPIATNTLSSATGTVTFSSISGSYTDLILISNIKSGNTNQASLLFRVNASATGSLYSGTMIYGTGSAAGSNRQSNQNQGTIMRNGGLSATYISANNINSYNGYSQSNDFGESYFGYNNDSTDTYSKIYFNSTTHIPYVSAGSTTGASYAQRIPTPAQYGITASTLETYCEPKSRSLQPVLRQNKRGL